MSEFVPSKDGTPVRRSKRVREHSDSDDSDSESNQLEAGFASNELRQRGREARWSAANKLDNDDDKLSDDEESKDEADNGAVRADQPARQPHYIIEDHMVTKLAVAALAMLAALAFVTGRPFQNAVLFSVGPLKLYVNESVSAVSLMFALGVLLAVMLRTVAKKNE
jgi:hypothetical protein